MQKRSNTALGVLQVLVTWLAAYVKPSSTIKKGSMPALGWWLIAVGAFRSAYTWSCFFGYELLSSATFSEIKVTGVHGRTVAVSTLLSSTLCFLCAFNLHSRPLYVATFLSFVYVIGYMSIECVVYHTISAASLVPFIFIAGTSIVWMLLQWNSQGHGPSRRGATSKLL